MSQKIDHFSENPPELIRSYTIKENDGPWEIADNLGIKISAVQEINPKVWESYSLVHWSLWYILLQGKNSIKSIPENLVYLETYNFSGFNFELKKVRKEKESKEYVIKGKNWVELPFRIKTVNLDKFMESLNKVLLIIRNESSSRLLQRDLAHEVTLDGDKKLFPGSFDINSKAFLDLIPSSIDMNWLISLLETKTKNPNDNRNFLKFLLNSLNVK